mgnify:CR=1 FL=1
MLLDYCNKRYFSTLTPTIYINTGCLPVLAVGAASMYDSRAKQRIKSCYCCNQPQSLGIWLIGLPLASRSPIVMVKSPMPGACAAAFTVGLPKPRSASHVAASMRSLLEAFSSRNTLRTKSVSSLPSAVCSSPSVSLGLAYGDCSAI